MLMTISQRLTWNRRQTGVTRIEWTMHRCRILHMLGSIRPLAEVVKLVDELLLAGAWCQLSDPSLNHLIPQELEDENWVKEMNIRDVEMGTEAQEQKEGGTGTKSESGGSTGSRSKTGSTICCRRSPFSRCRQPREVEGFLVCSSV
uniref:Uncharacterized protein n=1 Tax=Eutreptiella gymnastica TaxID=73025 RepID=A0A7S1IA28_9EUGL